MIETLGRYQILTTIGQGAMGVVYKAIDPVIDRTVAIKTINLSLENDEMAEYESRFQQEIKAVGRLNHPNIVTIYDVGRTDKVTYMAMEFLEGRELKDILADTQRPSISSCVRWIQQIAQGLQLAHENGIVHRDIKPSNIMVVRGDLAKITDFGIARMPESAVKTMTGMILGSPRYMSPEQVAGAELDHRTDIFSLGVVLYEALTGRWPFDGASITNIMYATVNATPLPPSSIVGDLPKMLDLIVAKALAKKVDDRYQTMHELADDLGEVLRRYPTKSAGTPARAKPPEVKSPAPVPEITSSGRYQEPAEESEESRALKLLSGFDSFEATVKLAALTDQTTEFSSYISETQKMRKFSAQPAESAMKADAARKASVPKPEVQQPAAPAAASRTPMLILVVLASLAVGLAIALAVL